MLVFVYGTLKRHQRNHHVLDRATFVGEAVTRHRFKMFDVGFPILLGPTVDGYKVRGEVYNVGPGTLAHLDLLESKGRMYDRKRYYVDLADGTRPRVHMYIGLAQFWTRAPRDPVPVAGDVYTWPPVQVVPLRSTP